MAQLVNPPLESSDGAGSVAPAARDAAEPTARRIEGPAAEPISPAGQRSRAWLKRLLPAVGGLVVLLLALRRRRD